MARSSCPARGGHDLPSIAAALGVAVPGHHRALQDAQLAREVFLALLERIGSTRVDLLLHVLRLASPTWPYRGLFEDAERRQHQFFMQVVTEGTAPGADLGLTQLLSPPERTYEPLVSGQQSRRVDVEQLRRALGPGGSLARELPGERGASRAAADARGCLRELQSRRSPHGRGRHRTGKSLAYLLPALAFAVANNQRVVVSTNTINLQDQLFEKDVPDIIRAMDYRARAAVLKGRTNYVCLRRWLALLKTEGLAPDDAGLLIKTLFWIGQTRRGDRAELG